MRCEVRLQLSISKCFSLKIKVFLSIYMVNGKNSWKRSTTQPVPVLCFYVASFEQLVPLNNTTIQNYLKYNRKLRQHVFIHLHLSKRCSTTAIMHSLLLQWCVKWSLHFQKSPGSPLPPIPNIHTLLRTILHIIFGYFFFIASSVCLLWTSRSHTVLFTVKRLIFSEAWKVFNTVKLLMSDCVR